MGFFGAIISLAFSDINDKAGIIDANKILINSFLSPENYLLTIEEFIDFEFQEHLVHLTGNSYQANLRTANGPCVFLSEYKEQLWYYQSTAWVIIRGAWFYDFLAALFSNMEIDKNLELSKCAVNAYNFSLKKHHPWIIQRAALLGMNALPGRASFTAKLTRQESKVQRIVYSELDLDADIKKLRQLCERMSAHLWGIFVKKGISEVN